MSLATLSNDDKLATAKQFKQTGDTAFNAKNTRDALMAYHQALLYLLGLDKNAMDAMNQSGSTPSAPAAGPSGSGEQPKERTEVDILAETIYANQAACHIRNENWKRAVETADKALAKNSKNYKAMLRKGKALGAQGFYEKSVKLLKEVKENSPNPKDVEASGAELRIVEDQEKVRTKQAEKKFKGFLSKPKGAGALAPEKTQDEPSSKSTSKIEELPDDA